MGIDDHLFLPQLTSVIGYSDFLIHHDTIQILLMFIYLYLSLEAAGAPEDLAQAA